MHAKRICTFSQDSRSAVISEAYGKRLSTYEGKLGGVHLAKLACWLSQSKMRYIVVGIKVSMSLISIYVVFK